MALRDFLFGFKFLATDYVSPVLKNIETRIEAVNQQVKNTARWREAGTNLAYVGAGIAAVGGGVGMVLKGFVNSAAEMDEHLRHLSTTLDAGAAGVRQLAQAHELANKWAVQYNYASKDIIDNLHKSISFTGSYNAGVAVTAASLAVAKGNMGDAATVGQSLSIMFNDWPGKIGQSVQQANHLADLLAYTSRHGAFNSVNDVTAAMSIAAGSIKAAGMTPEDAMAMAQAYSRVGMVGTEAGSAIMETLQAFSKGKLQKELGVALATTRSGALDVIGTMVNLRREMGSGVITAQQFQRASAALGIRGERALAVDVNALVAFRKQLSDPSLINGAAMQGAMTMMGAFNETIGALGKRWDILSEILGKPLLGAIAPVGLAIGRVMDKVIGLATAHPQIVKFVMTFAALGAAVAVAAGGAIALVGGLMIAASFIPLAGAVTAGIAAIGAAIVGVTAYLYTWHPAFLKAVGSLAGEAFSAGAKIVMAIGSGIWSAITFPQHAIEAVVSKIRAYLPFSPAKEGPLRSLHRVRIVEELSRSIQPGPALIAMRRTAAAVAIAAPVMLSPMMASSAMAGSAAGAGGGVTINIEYKPSINLPPGANAREVMDVLRAHDSELLSIIERRMKHHDRREF